MATTGQPTPIGGTYNFQINTSGPSLNNSGEVAFVASIAGGGAGGAIFKWKEGSDPTKVVASSDDSPFGAGFTFECGGPFTPVLNNIGAVAFASGVCGVGVGIFVEYQGVIRTAVSSLDTPPGGGTWGAFLGLAFNDRGDIGFHGQILPAFISGIFFARAQADMSATKSDVPDPATVGSNLRYIVVLTNDGPDLAPNVILADTLPPGVSIVSVTPSQGSCGGTSPISCSPGTLAPGAIVTVTILITPTTTGAITDTASVTSAALDSDLFSGRLASANRFGADRSRPEDVNVLACGFKVSASGLGRAFFLLTDSEDGAVLLALFPVLLELGEGGGMDPG